MKKIALFLASAFLLQSCNNTPPDSSKVSNEYRVAMRSLISSIKTEFPSNTIDTRQILIHDGLEIIYRGKDDRTVEYNFTRSTIDGAVQPGIYTEYLLSGKEKTERRDSLHSLISVVDSSIYSNFSGSIEYDRGTNKDSLLHWNDDRDIKTFLTSNPTSYNIVTDIHDESTSEILNLNGVENFLLMSDFHAESNETGKPPYTNTLVEKLKSTNFDLVIIRPEVDRTKSLPNSDKTIDTTTIINAAEIDSIRTKGNGVKNDRLVYCAINLSRADSRSLYWKPSWNSTAPTWMTPQSGSQFYYDVDFRNSEWKDALLEPITGTQHAYITQIKNAGFDGLYLMGVGAFHEFEGESTGGDGTVVIN